MKFSKPPSIKNLTDELRNDTIRDKWEWSEDCETNQTLCDIPYDNQPIIGILTQPVAKDKKDKFNYTDYILEINDNFVKWGGSRTVAIPYNITKEKLFSLLR